MKKILVIEDDPAIRANVLELLEAEGYDGHGAADGRAGVDTAMTLLPDLVICDIMLPEIDGYEVLKTLRASSVTATVPFLFLSSKADKGDVRKGMNLGADDYLTKPFSRRDLLEAIDTRLARLSALETHARAGSLRPGPAAPVEIAPSDGVDTGGVVLRDPTMLRVYEQATRVAASPINVLILGETGVGKEILAHELHARSPRAKRPFLALNCASLSETLLESELFGHERGAFTGAQKERAGLFESAQGGTVFLDEVGELPLGIQAKLLRVIEDRQVRRVGGRASYHVDIRFVAATNRDLEAEAERGTFRLDLYYRLNGAVLTLPPLRERPLEIEPLARAFLARAAVTFGVPNPPAISVAALQVLRSYTWPGNVRELRNVVERALALCTGDILLPEHIPEKLRGPQPSSSSPPSPASPTASPSSSPPLSPHGALPSSSSIPPAAGRLPSDPAISPSNRPEAGPRDMAVLRQEMADLERQRIMDALAQCGGNQSKAAELLGISRRTLVSRLDEYDLPRPRKR